MQPRNFFTRVARPRPFITISLIIAIAFGNPGLARAAEPQQKVYYFLHDHLGGISAVTDEEGNVVERRDYLPFGSDRLMPDAQYGDYGFTGKEKDPESELYYYGARYYDPFTGRFISPDPLLNALDNMNPQELQKFLENPQNLNPYTYVNNNPINNVDLEGEFWIQAAKAILTFFFNPKIAYAPDDEMSKQISKNVAPHQQDKSDVISAYAKAELAIGGVKQIRAGGKIVSKGIEAAKTMGEEKAIQEALSATYQVNKGLTKMTLGGTDAVRAVIEENPQVTTFDIIKKGILDPVKKSLNKWFSNQESSNDLNQNQPPEDPVDSWFYWSKNSDKKIELKDKDQ